MLEYVAAYTTCYMLVRFKFILNADWLLGNRGRMDLGLGQGFVCGLVRSAVVFQTLSVRIHKLQKLRTIKQ